MGLFSKIGKSITAPGKAIGRAVGLPGLEKKSRFKNPADDAMPYLDQIPGVGQKYFDPYVQQGQQAGQELGGEYDRMTNDPTGFINEIMKNYAPSQGYQTQSDELRKLLSSTAAAGGISGTPYDQHQQGQEIQKLLSGDMQQFLQNALGVYGQGIGGKQSFYNKGYDASKELSDLLSQVFGSKAGLAFEGRNAKNQNIADMMNMFAQLLGQGAGLAFGKKPTPKIGG